MLFVICVVNRRMPVNSTLFWGDYSVVDSDWLYFVTGLSLSELKVQKADVDEDERVYWYGEFAILLYFS